ncbi:hypothetical protein EYF80_040698 [Liparis tanakae]|uniref:Uncharacterized protein n=1 Tax=Liparis tanakae TaxID=230148 RepID=A0A4Z2G828_9TELE|nr:hypothetical protein EYF80_040698 [Liparis tanakae]
MHQQSQQHKQSEHHTSSETPRGSGVQRGAKLALRLNRPLRLGRRHPRERRCDTSTPPMCVSESGEFGSSSVSSSPGLSACVSVRRMKRDDRRAL